MGRAPSHAGSRASAEPGPWRTSRTPYLKDVMDALSAVHPARRVVFMKGAQVGAPLAITTPIPTAEGWATMGSLIIGDTLFDEHGQPCRVIGVSPTMIGRDCYRITFDDGESVVCDGEHRWHIRSISQGREHVAVAGWQGRQRGRGALHAPSPGAHAPLSTRSGILPGIHCAAGGAGVVPAVVCRAM